MKIIPYIAVFTLLFFSCKLSSQSVIPNKWEPGMTLTMSHGGGMMYYSYKLQISDTGSYFMENVQGAVSYYRLDLSAKDLDSLATYLSANQLDRIEMEMKGPMHDKGSENISLSWAGHYAGAGESYMMVIKEKWEKAYNNISAYLYQIRETKKKKVKSIPGLDPLH
jgi:hypothetical protein